MGCWLMSYLSVGMMGLVPRQPPPTPKHPSMWAATWICDCYMKPPMALNCRSTLAASELPISSRTKCTGLQYRGLVYKGSPLNPTTPLEQLRDMTLTSLDTCGRSPRTFVGCLEMSSVHGYGGILCWAHPAGLAKFPGRTVNHLQTSADIYRNRLSPRRYGNMRNGLCLGSKQVVTI